MKQLRGPSQHPWILSPRVGPQNPLNCLIACAAHFDVHVVPPSCWGFRVSGFGLRGLGLSVSETIHANRVLYQFPQTSTP